MQRGEHDGAGLGGELAGEAASVDGASRAIVRMRRSLEERGGERKQAGFDQLAGTGAARWPGATWRSASGNAWWRLDSVSRRRRPASQ